MGELAIATLAAQITAWALLFSKRTQATLPWRIWAVLSATLALMGLLAYQSIWHPQGLSLSLPAVATTILFAINLAIILGQPHRRTWALALITLPAAMIATLSVLWLPPSVTVAVSHAGEALHIVFAITGYSLLLTASAQAAGLGYQDNRLRTHKLASMAQSLPPIQSMESAMLKTLTLGTIVLGGAIVLGFVVYDNLLERHVAHKTLFAIAAWATYAWILARHYLKGVSGVRSIKPIAVATIMLILAYFGAETIALLLNR